MTDSKATEAQLLQAEMAKMREEFEARLKSRPYFLISGGSYKQQRKAKKLNQWVEGVFYEEKVYDQGLDAFRDGLIGGFKPALILQENEAEND